MFSSSKDKVTIPPEMYARLRERAARLGYGSVDELVVHVLERELRQDQAGTDTAKDALIRKMKGLGYL